MAKKEEQQNDLLSLGSLHEEVEKEEKRRKGLKFPIVLIGVGIVFILIGTFYKNILSFVETSKELFRKKEPTTKVGQILKCNTKKNESELGISTNTTTIYHFKKDLLKTVEKDYVYQPLTNSSEIGSSNLTVYHERFQNSMEKIGHLEGIDVDLNYSENKITIHVEINYEILDATKVPQNDIVSIDNKLGQTYREIKEIEGRAGHLCTTK